MEFTNQIDKQKALIIARESIVYGYGFRKKQAKKAFGIMFLIGTFGLAWVLAFKDLFNQFSNPLLFLFIFGILLSGLLFFKAEQLQIYALQEQTKRLYKEKSVIKYGVIIDSEQLAFMKKDGTQKSYKLESIKHLIYRSDLEGLFFSESKLARFVFFVDLSILDESLRLEFFNILLKNLQDVDAKKELRESISKE